MNTRVEYRAGWLSPAGEFRPFAQCKPCGTFEESQADLADMRHRFAGGANLRSDVARAIAAGRVEVRSRVVTTTPWEVAQ